MVKVSLKPLFHRDTECIGIYFEKNKHVQQAIQKIPGARWSKTNSCWYISCTGESYYGLKSAIENIAEIENGELRKFLIDKKKVNAEPEAPDDRKIPINIPDKKIQPELPKSLPQTNLLHTLSNENRDALQQFKRELVLKGYSQSTIKTYTNEFIQFLNTIKDKPAADFSATRLKDYLQYCNSILKFV